MKKPSMYSARYGKAQKRARRRRALGLAGAALVLFLLFFVPYLLDKLREYEANGYQFPERVVITIPTATTPAATAAPATTAPAGTTAAVTGSAQTSGTAPAASQDQILIHRLSGGQPVSIRYQASAQGIRYLDAQGPAGMDWDIAPDASKLLILDPAGQSLTVFGSELAGVDRSFNSYENSQLGTFQRKDKAGVDGFIWMTSPKFLTPEIILYQSQLSRTMDDLYLWALMLSEGRHRLISGTSAQTMEFIERTPAGYRIRLDEREVLVTDTLEVSP